MIPSTDRLHLVRTIHGTFGWLLIACAVLIAAFFFVFLGALPRDPNLPLPKLVFYFPIVIVALAWFCGVALLYSAHGVSEYRHPGFALAMSVLLMLFFPLGTVAGGFCLWALTPPPEPNYRD